ncbi:MAG: NAD(P)-dependent glycerol-3-phosphate dehydrogenase [Candidatus Omnitrophica bacterium]|nr:NAD(P)-dependent glycerol-3-phosphate dehydrogenase [Candidatus Omnitrophota bacterium]
MPKTIKNISVIGDGGWGTTLAVHLAKENYPVRLWGPFPAYVRRVGKNRYNTKFLPGIHLPYNITLTESLAEAIREADLIVFAIPSKYANAVLKKIKTTKADLSGKILLSVTKGIDTAKLLRMSEIIRKELGSSVDIAVLSGPTIAMEVAKNLPSTAVVASRHLKTAKQVQAIFNSESFRVYTNTDVTGVELGGSIKNIIALACGVCDGLGFGSNTKAAILTRGLAEMARLGKALGAKQQTFSGLTGLGDLVTTCVSPQSRNRSVGENLGRGKSIKAITSRMEMVAEGIETVKAVYRLSQKHHVSMPITTEVYNIIYRKKKPSQAVSDLMKRRIKSE